MSIIVDLRPVEIEVKFTPGSTIAFTLYYLGKTGDVVDLSTYTGSIIVRDTTTGCEVLEFSKSLPIVTADIEFQGIQVVGANGLYIEYSSALTTEFVWDYLRFECLIVSTDGIITPIAVGSFEPCRV